METKGYLTFLPQRDGKLLAELLREGESKESAIQTIFNLDVDEIKKADILLLILDGRVPDERAMCRTWALHTP
ncbi:hypothetical protein [Methanosphaerula palustris]|uniref:hypothetical protein n=1 Tax=Methanosphaerula palustris TaxID=475088 RepID=UPI0013052B9F|nr:hypothetical protein [Methanosphaerula palustris]